MPTLTLLEQKDCEKNLDNQNGFPWTLIQDRDNVEKYWSSAVLPNADPSVAMPIGLGIQISEPNWAGFTFDGTFTL